MAEVDPLPCPRWGQEGRRVEMVIAAWFADLEVVDHILRHRRERGLEPVLDVPPARAPPTA